MLASSPINAITATEVARWQNTLPGGAYSRRNASATLNLILKAAGNPTRATLPRLPEKDAHLLAPSDRTAFYALAKTREEKLILYVLAMAGLRRSELAGLRYEDVQDGGLNIRRAVVFVGGVLYIKEPKNRKSKGWVAVPQSLVDLIGKGSGYVLTDSEVPMTPGAVYRSFRRIVTGTRFADVEMHDLRRTFGMDMLESGVDLRTAAEQMRHDPAMLANIYSRSRRDLKRAAAAKVFGGDL